MAKKFNTVTQLQQLPSAPSLKQNKLGLNPALVDEIVNNTSRKSKITSGNEMLSNEAKMFTGGVDFSRVASTLNEPVNIFHGDIQQRLGEKQSALDKWGNFSVQVGAEILGGSLEGIGYLGDVKGTATLLDGDMSSFGNWFSDIGISMKEGSRENFPIFGAHDMGNLGFWLSNGVSVASSLSLMIPAVGAVKGVSMLGKAVGLAAKLNKPAKAFMSTLGQAFTSRHMENMMESSGVWTQTRDIALSKGKTLAEANLIASDAARGLYVTNYALMAQDFLQYRLLARGPKINADITSRRLASALGVNAKEVTAKAAYGIAADMASEGVEEGLQFVFSEEQKHRALNKAGLVKDSQLGDRLKKYGQDSEMWTSVLFGGLGAGIMQGGRKATNAMGVTGKAEKAQLEARIAHAKQAHELSTAAGMKLQAAMKSGKESAILQAEQEMIFNIAYTAAQAGNFDLAMATIDDLIESSPEEATKEGSDFADNYKEKLQSVKKDMKKVGNLYEKNAKKYSSDTVQEITLLQYNNMRWNAKLPEIKIKEAEAKSEVPLQGNLSSQGQEIFQAKAEEAGLEQAIKIQRIIANSEKKGTLVYDRAVARGKKFQKEKDRVSKVVKALESREEKSIALDKGDPNNINSSYDIANTSLVSNEQRVKKDKEILKGIEQNNTSLKSAISERILLEEAISENNSDLENMTSKKGQVAAEEVFDALRKEREKAEKEEAARLKKENQKKKNDKKQDSVNTSVNNTEQKDPELSGNESVNVNTVETFTDKELDEKIESTSNPEVKQYLQKEKDRRIEVKKVENKKLADAKVTSGAQLIDKVETTEIESADNNDQREQEDQIINESSQTESLVAKSGSSIAWKTTTGLRVDELAEQVSAEEKENAIALSEFLEDPTIDKTEYKLEFFIDKEKLKNSLDLEDGVEDTLKDLYIKLTDYKNGKGPALTSEELGVLPVRAYIVNNKGERITYGGGKSEITAAMHNTTFERWNELEPADQQAAINEVLATKEKILNAMMNGKTATADITSVRNGHLMTQSQGGKFSKNNVATATGIAPSEMTIVMGDTAAKGDTSRYITQEKEKTEEYDDLSVYSSATPGAVYVVIKTANGQSFPLRLFVQNLSEEESELVYNLYAKTFENESAYKENLEKHPDIKNFIKNSKDPRVAGLTSFINIDKITIADLLKVIVYEGKQTSSSGLGALITGNDRVRIGDVNINKDQFLTENGKKTFIENLMKKRKQVSISLVNNPAYVSYLVNTESVTTNATNVKGVMFRHPTTEFGEVEIGTPSKKAENKTNTTPTPVVQPTVVEVKVDNMTVVYDAETGAMTFKGSQKEVTSETVKNKALVKYETRQGTIRTATYNGTEYKVLSDDRIISMAKTSVGKEVYKSGKVRETILAQVGEVTPTSTKQDTSQLTDEEVQLLAEAKTEKFLADEKTESLSIDDIINQEKTTEAEKEILNFIKKFWGGRIMYQKNYNFDVPMPNAQGGFDTGSWGGTFDPRTNSVLIFGEQNLDAEFVIHEAMHGLLQTKLEQSQGFAKDFDPVFSAEVNRLYEIAKAALPADKYYGLTDPHEFLSEAFGDPEFRKELAKLVDPEGGTNLLTSFIEAIRKFFSDNGIDMENSVLDSILATTTRTLNSSTTTTDTSADSAQVENGTQGTLTRDGYVAFNNNDSHSQDSVRVENGWAMVADGVSSNKNSKAFADALLKELSKDPMLELKVVKGIIEDVSKKFKDAAATLALTKRNPDGSFTYFTLGDSQVIVVDKNGNTKQTFAQVDKKGDIDYGNATHAAVAGYGINGKFQTGKINLKPGEKIVIASDGIVDVFQYRDSKEKQFVDFYKGVTSVWSKDQLESLLDSSLEELSQIEVLSKGDEASKTRAANSFLLGLEKNGLLYEAMVKNPELINYLSSISKGDDNSFIVLDSKFAETQQATTDTTTGENPGKVLAEQIIAEVKEKEIEVELNPDGTQSNYYKDKDGNIYLRATARVNPMETGAKEKPLVQSSLNIGTKVDALIRDFFDENSDLNSGLFAADKDNIDPSVLFNYGLGDAAMVQEFLTSLQSLKEHFYFTGETVIPNDILLHSENLGIAGTVDLLTYDKQGNIRIYDVKSMRGNQLTKKYSGQTDVVYNGSYKGNKSSRQKHIDQLSTYALILKDKYGVDAVQLGILPIEVGYKNNGIVHKETEVLKRVYDNGAPFIDVKNDPNVLERTATAYDNSDGSGYSSANENLDADENSDNTEEFADIDLSIDDIETGTEVNLNNKDLTNPDTAEGIQPAATNAGDAYINSANNLVDSSVFDILGIDNTPKPSRPKPSLEKSDKIVFGHPLIGKSFLKENNDNRFLSLDDDPKYLGQIEAGREAIISKYPEENLTKYDVQNSAGTEVWHKEYKELMQGVYEEAKQDAISSGKTLMLSNTELLKNNLKDFDKIINIDTQTFLDRVKETRPGAKYDIAAWKDGINEVIKGADKSKLINTKGYLSELLPTTTDTTTQPSRRAKPSKDVSEVINQNPTLENDLDTRLKGLLSQLNVSTIVVDNLSERLAEKGFKSDAVAISDILHKAVFLDSNKYNTKDYAEQVSKFVVEFMGASKHAEASPLISSAIQKIDTWEKYDSFYNVYKNDPLYQDIDGKVNDRKIKVEILSKLLSEKIMQNKNKQQKTPVSKKVSAIERTINKILSLFDRLWKSDYYRAIDRFLKRTGIETKGVSKVNLKPFDATINEIVDSVLFSDVSRIVNDGPRARKGNVKVDLPELLRKNAKVKNIYDKLNVIGFMFTGSAALSREGNVFRESNEDLHDLDYVVPKELEGNFIELIQQAFPGTKYKINERTNEAQKFEKADKITHTLMIDGMPVDFFEEKTGSRVANQFGDLRWQDTFEEKLKMGRNKDIRDLIDFKTKFNDYFSNPLFVYSTQPQQNRMMPKPARPTTGAITEAEIAEVAEMVPESISTSVVEDYITLLDGGQAVVGAFQEGLIQISRRAKTGDGYHEAFHAVFRTMLSKEKQENLLEEARDMFMPLESDINELMSRHKISKERATNLFYEEQLADEFGVYAANPRAYDFNNKKDRKNYFERLLSWMKDILGVTGNMEKIFKNLKQGNFKSANNVNLLLESGVVEQVCKGY